MLMGGKKKRQMNNILTKEFLMCVCITQFAKSFNPNGFKSNDG